MNELISIIVPIYNVDKYIRKCIDSIVNQTYNNLEIILVDDGSPDQCGDICDSYAQADPRVIVLHKKNGGLSDARNKGIEASHGAYLAFIDADDWVADNYIETLYGMCSHYNCMMSQCDFQKMVHESDTKVEQRVSIRVFTNAEMCYNLYDQKLFISTTIACCKLYKKELLDGIRFPIGMIHEDEGTTYKLIYKADRISVSTQKLYYYRVNQNSITRSAYSIKALDILHLLEERADFFKRYNESELYNLTRKFYYYQLGINYYKIKRLLHGNEHICESLKLKINAVFRELIALDDFSLLIKCPLIIMRISPMLYVDIYSKIRNKLKNNYEEF